MLSVEQVVFLLTLLLAGAEEQKLASCEKYRYHIRTADGGYERWHLRTWEEVIGVLPQLNSREISCVMLRDGYFSILSGKLVGIELQRWNDRNKGSGYDLVKNLLALSNDLKHFYLELHGVNPTVLEENMFLSSKQLEFIRIEMDIQKIEVNTFSQLENLNNLMLIECRLFEFNPNELPSSLKHLILKNNGLQTFDLTKPLVNLSHLDLSENFLTRFILDLRVLLPNIIWVSLQKNKITDFRAIDNDLNYTLEHLDLDKNQIRNMIAYEWIHNNSNLSSISYAGNLPVCDCSSKETLDMLWKEKIVDSCMLPVPGEVKVDIIDFQCPPTDFRVYICSHFTVFDDGTTTTVANCSKALLPIKDLEYDDENLGNFKHFQLYLSGNSDVRALPLLPSWSLDDGIKIHIYAENCNLRSPFIEDNYPLVNLRHLYLANNSIDKVDVEILEHLVAMETHLTLANNPIICDCQHKTMYDTLVKMSHLIDDFDQLTCNDGLPFANRDLCIAWDMYLLYFALVLLTILTCSLVIFLRYTLEIQVYIYSRGWFPAYFRTEADEANYKYDVFLSYSDKDEDFVVSVIDFLEKEVSPPFKVCHHHRDWIVGERIDRQIIASVEESRKTIIILSRNFLASIWGNMEFRTALYTMLQEKAPKLVLIIHGDIGPVKELKPEIRTYIKSTTYLASDDKWFWKKLRYSLRRPIKNEISEPVQQDIEMTTQN